MNKYKGSTPGPWVWARDRRTRQEFLDYCAESWDRADPQSAFFNVIQVDVDGENRTVAILGNGPTAHINGPLIADAPMLAAENKRLRAIIDNAWAGYDGAAEDWECDCRACAELRYTP